MASPGRSNTNKWLENIFVVADRDSNDFGYRKYWLDESRNAYWNRTSQDLRSRLGGDQQPDQALRHSKSFKAFRVFQARWTTRSYILWSFHLHDETSE
jgi:hypothetical protein